MQMTKEGLLLRSPITQGYTPPSYHSKSLLYSRNVRPNLSKCHSEVLDNGNIFNTSFYTRHNPHPVRVKHLNGLLGNPVCMVEDNLERRILWSAPSGQDFSISYRPPGSTRYSANRMKHIPAVGIVPVTYTWKDELEKKTYNAISKALGQVPHLPSIQHEANKTEKKEFDAMPDDELLSLLCKILQTDSIPACQAWLQCASETEKTIVLNMLRMAATGEISHLNRTSNYTRPNSAQSLYIWRPENSKHDTKDESQTVYQQDPYSTAAATIDENPFKLPLHDTIIRTAHSQLSMRNSSDEKKDFHSRLQNELDQIEKKTRKLHSRGSQSRPISAGLFTSSKTSSQRRYRPRSHSAEAEKLKNDIYPTPPVKLQVTRPVNSSFGNHLKV